MSLLGVERKEEESQMGNLWKKQVFEVLAKTSNMLKMTLEREGRKEWF